MANRIQRHKRIRATVEGTSDRPRVAVFRSNRFIQAQIIDDTVGKTIVAASGPKNKPADVGKELVERATKAGVKTVVFDRGGYKYHGRVKALAEALRAGGLIF